METKRCTRCSEEHPITDFRFDNIAQNRRKTACRLCENRRMREDRAKNGAKRRETENRQYRRTADRTAINNLMRRYGLSKEQARRAALTFACDLCGKDNGGRRLMLDHCHATGKNRGLLCSECNLALGKFKDNAETVRRALTYLETGGSGRF